MHQRTIHNQRNRDGIIHQREPIQQKHPRPPRNGRQSLKSEQKQHQPEDGVHCFDGEFSCGEEQREEGDVAGDGERAESAEVSKVFEGEEAEG